MPRTFLDEPASRQQAESAESASDQVATIVANPDGLAFDSVPLQARHESFLTAADNLVLAP